MLTPLLMLVLSSIAMINGAEKYDNCGKQYFPQENETIELMSHHYPVYYKVPHHCKWTVSAKNYNSLFVFCSFEIEESRKCQRDSLSYFDHDDNFITKCGKDFLNVVTFSSPVQIDTYFREGTKGGKYWCRFTSTEPDNPESCACGWHPAAEYIKTYSFLAALVENNQFKASATIISRYYALTSASGLNKAGDFDKLELLVGGQDSQNLENYKLEKSIVHESYDASTLQNNIALIKTVYPISFNDYVGYVCLPFNLVLLEDNDADTPTVLGWTSDDMEEGSEVVATNVTIVDQEECQSQLGKTLTKENQCTEMKEGAEDCMFQEGTPLVYQLNYRRWSYYLLYLYSYGDLCSGFAVNTKISDYLDWIETNAEGESFCKKERKP